MLEWQFKELVDRECMNNYSELALRRRLAHARGDSFVAAPLLRRDPLGSEVSTKPQLCSLRGY